MFTDNLYEKFHSKVYNSKGNGSNLIFNHKGNIEFILCDRIKCICRNLCSQYFKPISRDQDSYIEKETRMEYTEKLIL